MFQIIFQFAFFFLEQTYLQKNDVIYQYKKPINGEKLKLFLKISINVTGVPLKPMRMQMKLTIISYQHFVQFMMLFFL